MHVHCAVVVNSQWVCMYYESCISKHESDGSINFALLFPSTLQGGLTPEGAIGVGTVIALGAVAMGVLVAAVWYVTRRRS